MIKILNLSLHIIFFWVLVKVFLPATDIRGQLLSFNGKSCFPSLGCVNVYCDLLIQLFIYVNMIFYCVHLLQQICHRDLKLENTLLDGSTAPCVKICDFGYSKVMAFTKYVSSLCSLDFDY